MYLVDTNVLSEAAPTRTTAFADLVEWMDWSSDRLFLSVVTIAEIEDGASRAEAGGATRKAATLRAWLEAVEHLYGPRILPLDIRTAHIVGRLSARARANGFAPGFADAAIAATAQAHELTVMTRNVRHFEPMGVASIDPYGDGFLDRS